MPSYYTYSTPVTITTGFSGTPVSANGGLVVGSAIDNASNKWTHADLMLSLWFVGAPEYTSGNVQIGLRYSFDKTVWEDTDAILIVDSIFIPAQSTPSTPHRCMLKDIKILPYYFAIVVRNMASDIVYTTISGRARRMVFEAY